MPAIIAALAATVGTMGSLGRPAVNAGSALGTPPSRAILVAENDESPLPPLSAPHWGFPEVTRGLRWVPPGQQLDMYCNGTTVDSDTVHPGGYSPGTNGSDVVTLGGWTITVLPE